MIRTLVAVLVAIASGALGAWLILANAYPLEGPWVAITPGHGIHAGDVLIVLAWVLVVTALLLWARRGAATRRRHGRRA